MTNNWKIKIRIKTKFYIEGTDEVENTSLPEINQSQAVFPTSIASVVVNLIDLLSDYNIGQESQPINELCEKVILNCLIDDSPLFLRYFFEKITQKEKKVLFKNIK
jgi:hypothetical protein